MTTNGGIIVKDGFIKVSAVTPKVKVADCDYNGQQMIFLIKEAEKNQVKLLVFPELCITGYTCGDLFLQDTLINGAKEQLFVIVKETEEKDVLVVFSMPYIKDGKLYNVAAVVHRGRVLGFIPKTHIPNYSEFYEARHFTKGSQSVVYVTVKHPVTGALLNGGEEIPFGTNLLFRCKNRRDLVLGVEICEDLWVAIPPSSYHAKAGATVIANLSASDETTGKESYRRDLVKNQSARLVCGYIYADAGDGESTTDVVYGSHNMIVENGALLKESSRFKNETIVSELDLGRLASERRRLTTFQVEDAYDLDYEIVEFEYGLGREWLEEEEAFEGEEVLPKTSLTRTVWKTPFVPGRKEERDSRCDEILTIQAMGLKKRLEHTNSKSVVLGISGGLDSTLALLVTVKAFDMLKKDRTQIIAVTMPCFGTTDRTYENAITLSEKLGVTLKEIPIMEAVRVHLKDIEHSETIHDITYENAQARERTQVLMNIANKYSGFVIGTGDMSELALGWATYNGDHMSMYGVNCSVPKTLVRYLVAYYAETLEDKELQKVLRDVLDTPVSPELIPPKDGEIVQKTEDLVGPYELHDFFLYYMMRFGFTPSKIYRLAVRAFQEEYTKETILKWLKCFYRRFFTQQFKRSCLPDGPKVGSVAVSPRGDLRMPSDACASLWQKDIEEIE